MNNKSAQCRCRVCFFLIVNEVLSLNLLDVRCVLIGILDLPTHGFVQFVIDFVLSCQNLRVLSYLYFVSFVLLLIV